MHKSWWQGSRGEWYLVIQAILFFLIATAPHTFQGSTAVWSPAYAPFITWAGYILILSGILIAGTGLFNLGKNLTPLPTPKDNATLIVTGAYGLVRHPIYSGIIFISMGWAVWQQSWPTIVYTLLLGLFFDIKSRREERLLAGIFPEYVNYRDRVRKLLPFIY